MDNYLLQLLIMPVSRTALIADNPGNFGLVQFTPCSLFFKHLPVSCVDGNSCISKNHFNPFHE